MRLGEGNHQEGKNTFKAHLFKNIDICPVCGQRSLQIIWSEYEIPHIGTSFLISQTCLRCGYRHREIIPLESKKPKRIIFQVTGPRDMYVKIVRSPFAKIIIPEVGLEISPGIAAEIYITNIEGILRRIEDVYETFKLLDVVKDTQARVVLKKIDRIKRTMKFTIIIEDKYGLSKIIAEDEEQRKRVKEEVIEDA